LRQVLHFYSVAS